MGKGRDLTSMKSSEIKVLIQVKKIPTRQIASQLNFLKPVFVTQEKNLSLGKKFLKLVAKIAGEKNI